jgi:hypothetical protein
MCLHHPYGAGARAANYGTPYKDSRGIPLFSLWDAANFLGLTGNPGALDAVNPQDHCACSNPLTAFDEPMEKPLAVCNSLGVHEGYAADYIREHARPLSLGGEPPTIPIATPMAFVDGHAKYMRMSYYDALSLIVAPNKGDPAGARALPAAPFTSSTMAQEIAGARVALWLVFAGVVGAAIAVLVLRAAGAW